MGKRKNKLQKRKESNLIRKLLCLSIFLLSSVCTALSQAPTQVIRGNIYDEVSKEFLAGAEVFLKDTDPLIGAVTDVNGNFLIEKVHVGRYILVVKFLGYGIHSEELLVKAGSSPTVKIGLMPVEEQLDEIIISERHYTIIPGTTNRKITIEQTTRFAANYQDPARVMTSFPGVVVQNDQNNNIVVNGKSPNGILWRIEGLDVVNPNHLSNAGTFSDRPTQNGGGVNILSTQMLSSSTLVAQPFSAEYGNAYSGVMDMQFREGNKYENHYTLQASLLGLDVAVEGPIKKEKSSFLANYRYSTVGLLTDIGVDFGGEEIKFQDLSVKMDFDHDSGGSMSIFAFGGKSSNYFYGEQDTTQWMFDRDSTEILYGSSMIAAGFNDIRTLSSKTSINVGMLFSTLNNIRDVNSIDRSRNIENVVRYNTDQQLVSGKVELNTMLSSSIKLKVGGLINYYHNELGYAGLLNNPAIAIAGIEDGVLLQPYAQLAGNVNSRLFLEGGARYMKYNYNLTEAFLPNIKASYIISDDFLIYANAGASAQKQDLTVYLSNTENYDLPFSKIKSAALGGNYSLPKSIFSAEVFFQQMEGVPVHANISSNYSVFNEVGDFSTTPLDNLGKAEFYGVNLSLEQPFTSRFYYILSGALYESNYMGSDGIWRDSRYDGNYSFSASSGMEFFKEKQNSAVRTLSLNLRFLYAGGFRYRPIHEELSRQEGSTIFTGDYSQKANDYNRLDLRLAWRKEKENYTRIFAIDIQNVFSIQNDGFQYYDVRQSGVVNKPQLGIIPILLYRVEF